MLEMLAKYKPELLFVPGDKYEYSNTGYALLGLIIEKVSKQSYGDYLNKKIFKPLGMANTRVYRSRYKPEKISNYALGYVVDSLGNKNCWMIWERNIILIIWMVLSEMVW